MSTDMFMNLVNSGLDMSPLLIGYGVSIQTRHNWQKLIVKEIDGAHQNKTKQITIHHCDVVIFPSARYFNSTLTYVKKVGYRCHVPSNHLLTGTFNDKMLDSDMASTFGSDSRGNREKNASRLTGMLPNSKLVVVYDLQRRCVSVYLKLVSRHGSSKSFKSTVYREEFLALSLTRGPTASFNDELFRDKQAMLNDTSIICIDSFCHQWNDLRMTVQERQRNLLQS